MVNAAVHSISLGSMKSPMGTAKEQEGQWEGYVFAHA
jgi:hypothetical protein